MRKLDIINQISKDTGLHKVDVLLMVDSLVRTIITDMSMGNNIYIRGFGSFLVKTRKEKIGQNIQNRSRVLIPSRDVPSFKPSPEFQMKMDEEAPKRKQTIASTLKLLEAH